MSVMLAKWYILANPYNAKSNQVQKISVFEVYLNHEKQHLKKIISIYLNSYIFIQCVSYN